MKRDMGPVQSTQASIKVWDKFLLAPRAQDKLWKRKIVGGKVYIFPIYLRGSQRVQDLVYRSKHT